MVAVPLERSGARTAGLKNPLQPGRRIHAVLFDLDGTLYDQPRLRRLMAWELATTFLLQPFAAPRRLRGLRAYRKAQETLRHGDHGGPEGPQLQHAERRHHPADGPEGPELRHDGSLIALDRAQLALAARQAAIGSDELGSLVREWMEERPLKHLPGCGVTGLRALFDYLTGCEVQVGVFSDYPPRAKLRALGVDDACSLVLCASDPDIGAFKPHPRGFLVACERWGLSPDDVLMVGDRVEVDGEGARAAGMPCVIVGQPPSSTLNQAGVLFLPSLERLHRVLDDDR